MRRRAVIFDDEEIIRFALWRFFDKRQYEVFTFPYPDLCPLHIANECPCPFDTSCSDLIISDINMLGRNGIALVEGLMHKGCRQNHFALISSSFTDADRARAVELGCVTFDKPLDMETLKAWVEEVEGAIPQNRVLFDWTATLSNPEEL